jgi:hypothetical protein
VGLVGITGEGRRAGGVQSRQRDALQEALEAQHALQRLRAVADVGEAALQLALADERALGDRGVWQR